jgi:hypothetical protein
MHEISTNERVRYAALQRAGVLIAQPDILPTLDESDRLYATAQRLCELVRRRLDDVESAHAKPMPIEFRYRRPLGASWNPPSALAYKPTPVKLSAPLVDTYVELGRDDWSGV